MLSFKTVHTQVYTIDMFVKDVPIRIDSKMQATMQMFYQPKESCYFLLKNNP